MAQQISMAAVSAASTEHISLQAPAPTAVPTSGQQVRPLWLDDSPARQSWALADLIDQLPVDRIHHLLKTNGRLRVVEAVAGATLMGYECTRTSASSSLVYAGVQAIRLSAGSALEPKGFRIEPSVSAGGFAIYIRKSR